MGDWLAVNRGQARSHSDLCVAKNCKYTTKPEVAGLPAMAMSLNRKT
jgi:hypothetical protein